jgi:hypothetical protein
MDTRRSYYLQSNQDDFSELDAETRQFDTSDVPYVTPANDNAPTKMRLAAGALLRRLIALHRLRRPVT